MIKLRAPTVARILSVMVLAAFVAAPFAEVTASESSATVTGGVQVTNVGTLTVSIGEGDVGFRSADGGIGSISSSEGDMMYASVPITITDDRADGERDSYSIVLKVSNQTYGEFYILAGNITVNGVEGLPEAGLVSGFNETATFSEPVTVIRSEPEPPAGTFNITVNLAMHVPAGTVPGEYAGVIGVEVIPG